MTGSDDASPAPGAEETASAATTSTPAVDRVVDLRGVVADGRRHADSRRGLDRSRSRMDLPTARPRLTDR